ncbi:MAG: transaldolase [Nitrospirota bacterium]|jgi:transaldolase
MNANPLKQLSEIQSVWLDYLSRDIIASGKLRGFVQGDGLSGVTSNPTIFQKAISGGSEYDQPLEALVEQGMTENKEIFLTMAIEDIKQASDILLGAYREKNGRDGFVSIEVSPDLAHKTEETIQEASDIFAAVDRKNCLVKVPGTKEGLPAIEELTRRGVNVNITLLFSVERYKEVVDVFMKGLERRLAEGKPIDEIFSVASFFVSRVDTKVDGYLDRMDNPGAKELRGRAAVDNARLAYQYYKEVMASDRAKSLLAKGAKGQKLLWGSSSTKDPAYSDIKYVQELIAPDTVNTMPETTMDAFRDHGTVRVSIEDDLDRARALHTDLGSVGIDMEEVCRELEQEGVKKFSDSYFALLEFIGQKKKAFAR